MTVRVCRLCGTLAALEPHEHRPGDPWACPDCLRHLLDAAWVPAWVERAARHLRAVQ